MKERAIFIIKPDGVKLGEEERFEELVVDNGINIEARYQVKFTPDQVRRFYANVPYREPDGRLCMEESWIGYLSGGNSIVLEIFGSEANSKLQTIKKQLRIEFNHDFFYTGTHASDTPEDARREMGILGIKSEK